MNIEFSGIRMAPEGRRTMSIYKLDGQQMQHPFYGEVLFKFRRTDSGKRKSVVELLHPETKLVKAVFDLYHEENPLSYMGFTEAPLPIRDYNDY